MGVESRKAPPLPAPTDTDTVSGAGTELATEVSRTTEQTSYTLPGDGSPLTIPTRKGKGEEIVTRMSNKSQTSLLIEYYEGGKGAKSDDRRPSVRVKVTPSSKNRGRSVNEHIQITETSRNSRKPSSTKRINVPTSRSKDDRHFDGEGDSNSVGSYASATEESNLSRNPIEIEVRPMRHGSPLIPSAEDTSHVQQLGSDVSSMPANSFLDGKSNSPERKRSRSLSRGEVLAAGAATGLAAAGAAQVLKSISRRRSRSLSPDRVATTKIVEKTKGEKSERKHRHRSGSGSRSAEITDKHTETLKTPRRRSSRTHAEESLLSAGDSSLLTSSRVSGDQRSFRSTTSKSSINNPKLLETVEDAIRRLILPELNALKREQKAHMNRDKSNHDHRGSVTSGSAISRESREDFSGPRRVSSRGSASELLKATSKSHDRSREVSGESVRRKEKNIRHIGSDGSPRSTDGGVSEETIIRDSEQGHKKQDGKLGAIAAGLGLGALTAAAVNHHNSREDLDERQERRRRRVQSRSRSDSLSESYEEGGNRHIHPPLPLMSDITSSELTRSSILSADTERPHSASAEHRITPVHDVINSVTPTRTSIAANSNLGPLHTDIPRDVGADDNYRQEELDYHERDDKNVTDRSPSQEFEDDYHRMEQGRDTSNIVAAGLAGAAGGALLGAAAMHNHGVHDDHHYVEEEEDYYPNEQQVPAHLRYVPYNQTRRGGLSPIQSVSGYTEGEETGQQQQRDAHLSRSTGSYSTLDQSPRHRDIGTSEHSDRSHTRLYDFEPGRKGGLTDSELTQDADGEYWEEQHRENDKNRGLDEEGYRSSDRRFGYKNGGNFTDDSLDSPRMDRVAAGQSVRGIGANPDFVHTPVAVESAVASLLDASVLTGDSGHSGLNRQVSSASYDEGSERRFTSKGHSPVKHDIHSRDVEYEDSEADARSQQDSPSRYPEYELDESGRKITMPKYDNTRSIAKAGVAGIAAGAAASLIASRLQEKNGAPVQKSFKDRAMAFQDQPRLNLRTSDKIVEEKLHTPVEMTANAVPDLLNPMPEIGHGYEGSEADSHGSVDEVRMEGPSSSSRDHWAGQPAVPQPKLDTASAGRFNSGLKAVEAGAMGAVAGVGAATALAHRDRVADDDHDDHLRRTSEERKRDTLITNPYEGTSPVAYGRYPLDSLGYDGLNNGYQQGGRHFGNESPDHIPKDEGYISELPNPVSPGIPEPRLVGTGFEDDLERRKGLKSPDGDPFYTPNHTRQISGMSNGMASPLYEGATGYGIDRIQSKDIVALMDHLTVRDAQRGARDTEILVTLVRAAAEMRNSFEDMKRLLVDTEDVIITEVQGNTERSVQKVINGPRPLPPSATRSARGSDDLYDDTATKRRNVFRRALKGLSMRSNNDLAKIENMLVQLLGDVEGLKVAQGLSTRSPHDEEYDMQPEDGYENDHGYEPEGNAGTSTASHASQSGHFSLPKSRGTSATRGFGERRFSENRISTVPEGDEEDLDHDEETVLHNQFEHNEQLLTPLRETIRGGSAPLGTPPPQQHVVPASLSNENTPKTDKSKKHKSSSSFGWNPISKISRWSETTASTVARGFRSSGRKDNDQFDHPPSRSGSDLGNYDHPQTNPYGDDKLHTGLSQDNVAQYDEPRELTSLLPPEDPKYKAHRNSLNLQHPQPRPGPTHRYQTALESRAQDFNSPRSPQSMDWGSQSSLGQLPSNHNQNRYSNGTAGTGPRNLSPISDGHSFRDSISGVNVPGPTRPPKEALVTNLGPEVPPKVRPNKLTKPSPLSNENQSFTVAEKHLSNETSSSSAALEQNLNSSPRPLRATSGSAGVSTRKPTGPRSMGDSMKSRSGNLSAGEDLRPRNRNRDTFGTMTSEHSVDEENF